MPDTNNADLNQIKIDNTKNEELFSIEDHAQLEEDELKTLESRTLDELIKKEIYENDFLGNVVNSYANGQAELFEKIRLLILKNEKQKLENKKLKLENKALKEENNILNKLTKASILAKLTPTNLDSQFRRFISEAASSTVKKRTVKKMIDIFLNIVRNEYFTTEKIPNKMEHDKAKEAYALAKITAEAASIARIDARANAVKDTNVKAYEKNIEARDSTLRRAKKQTKTEYQSIINKVSNLSVDVARDIEDAAKKNEDKAKKIYEAEDKADKIVANFNTFILKNLFMFVLENPGKEALVYDYLAFQNIFQSTSADLPICSVTSLTLGKSSEYDENSLNLNATTLKIFFETYIDSLNLKNKLAKYSYDSKNSPIDTDQIKLNKILETEATNKNFIRISLEKTQLYKEKFTNLDEKFIQAIFDKIQGEIKNKIDNLDNCSYKLTQTISANESFSIYEFFNLKEQGFKFINNAVNELIENKESKPKQLKKEREFSIQVPILNIDNQKKEKLDIYDFSEFKDECRDVLFSLIKAAVNQQLRNGIPSPIKNLFLLDLNPPLVIEITLDATCNKDFKKGSIKTPKKYSTNNSIKIGEILFISGSKMSLPLEGELSAEILTGIYEKFKDEKLLYNSQANLIATYYSICQTIQKHLGIESIGGDFTLGIDKKRLSKSTHRLSLLNISDIASKTLERRNKKKNLKEYLKQAIITPFENISKENISEILKKLLCLTKFFPEALVEYDLQVIAISGESERAYIIKFDSDENEWILVRENTDDLIHSMLFKLAEGKKTIRVNEVIESIAALQRPSEENIQESDNRSSINKYSLFQLRPQTVSVNNSGKPLDENNNISPPKP